MISSFTDLQMSGFNATGANYNATLCFAPNSVYGDVYCGNNMQPISVATIVTGDAWNQYVGNLGTNQPAGVIGLGYDSPVWKANNFQGVKIVQVELNNLTDWSYYYDKPITTTQNDTLFLGYNKNAAYEEAYLAGFVN